MDTTTAGARLDVSAKHARRLAASGRLLGAYRRGRDWWIPDVAVDRLVAERAAGRRKTTHPQQERTPA